MSPDLARFLRRHFLDRKDRYLCFTSHWPLSMEASVPLGSTGEVSPRSVIGLLVPISTNLSLYNSILPSHVTPAQIAFYSGVVGSICAIMGSEFHNPQVKFREWFRPYKNEEPKRDWVVDLTSSAPEFMSDFMDEIFSGSPQNLSLREFDRFALHKLATPGTIVFSLTWQTHLHPQYLPHDRDNRSSPTSSCLPNFIYYDRCIIIML